MSTATKEQRYYVAVIMRLKDGTLSQAGCVKPTGGNPYQFTSEKADDYISQYTALYMEHANHTFPRFYKFSKFAIPAGSENSATFIGGTNEQA